MNEDKLVVNLGNIGSSKIAIADNTVMVSQRGFPSHNFPKETKLEWNGNTLMAKKLVEPDLDPDEFYNVQQQILNEVWGYITGIDNGYILRWNKRYDYPLGVFEITLRIDRVA